MGGQWPAMFQFTSGIICCRAAILVGVVTKGDMGAVVVSYSICSCNPLKVQKLVTKMKYLIYLGMKKGQKQNCI